MTDNELEIKSPTRRSFLKLQYTTENFIVTEDGFIQES